MEWVKWMHGILRCHLETCKGIEVSLVYSITDGRVDGMMGKRRRWGEVLGKRGDGGLLKQCSIQTSQRKEINGCLFVTVALYAKHPLIKQPPHIWHKHGAWGTNPSLPFCVTLSLEQRSYKVGLYWYWWTIVHILSYMSSELRRWPGDITLWEWLLFVFNRCISVN